MKEGTLIKPNGEKIAATYDFERDKANNIWAE
jgi:hypothetical protein